MWFRKKQNNSKFWLEAIGWLGVVLILAAYIGLNLKLFAVEDSSYLLLNFFGSVGIIMVAVQKKNYQPVVINVIWAIVAAWGLINLTF